jgi:hypothetical protein
MVLQRTAKKHGGVWHSIGVRGPEKGRFRFGGTDDNFKNVPPKRRVQLYGLHGVISQRRYSVFEYFLCS